MNFLKKTGQATSIEAKYLEGKARGFRHAPEVSEQLEIFKVQQDEVKKLKKVFSQLSKEEKVLMANEEKTAKYFTEESNTESQNPKGASVFRMYADCLSQVSSNRSAYIGNLGSVVSDWKVLSKTELGKLNSKLDVANKTLVTRQYHESNKEYVQAKQIDDKYSQQIIEWVGMVHELRERKENLHPMLILRALQSEIQFYRSITNQLEMCEGSVRQLGRVDPIKFPGFHMETKNYVNVDSSSQINNQNPYAGIGGQSQQQYQQPPPQQQQFQQPQQQFQQPQQPQQQGFYNAPAPLPPAPVAQLRAKGLYAFNGSSAQELSFLAGDVLTIISQEGAWWSAELGGRRGFIPSNYVQLI